MKFTEGLWRKPVGMNYFGAVEVAEVLKADRGGLEYTVSPRHVSHRGDTLNNPIITVEIASPMDDVLHVRIDNFRGVKDRGPHFELFPDGVPAAAKTQAIRTEDRVTFTSGRLQAELNTTPNAYELSFSDLTGGEPKFLCAAQRRGHAFADVPYHMTLGSQSKGGTATTFTELLPRTDHYTPDMTRMGGFVRYMQNELTLSVGENIYGLGERFGPFIKNGQGVDIWNDDGGTSSTFAYKNVPFYLSSRGYGVFVNHSEEVEYEIGREKSAKVGISVKGERLEYFIIGGGGIKQALLNYVRMTGRPALPPAWTYGLYLSTSFTTSYDHQTVSGFLQRMKDEQCPVRVFHFDCFWMKGYAWTNFIWDPECFPDPRAYLATLKKEYGVKVCCWINPYVSQRSELFKEGVGKGYFIMRTNGDVLQCNEWQGGLCIIDFTNPAAYKWYAGLITKLLDMGADTIKTDFGERIPHLDVVYHDGSDPVKAHNFYTLLYNRCVFEAVERKYGKNEAALFARSATAGGQRFPVHWGGDCESTYEAMAETLRGGLSLSCSGFAFWSHDIGGFEGTPNEALFCRWVAFGLFSSHSRLHGSASYRVPWNYGPEAVRVTAKMVRAKCRLMPYLYAQSITAHETGLPVLRSMLLEFPDDPAAPFLDKQYMLGDSLLVAPVFTDSVAEYYLPSGRWTDYWTGEVVEGPRFVRKTSYPLDAIPVFVRPGTILALGPEAIDVPDYEYVAVGLEVRSYELEEDAEAPIPSGKGPKIAGTIRVSKDGKVSASGVKLAKKVVGSA